MIYVNELKNMKMYKRKVRLPIDREDKRRGSAIMLITPDIDSSIKAMDHPLLENKYHLAYYLERSIMYYVNNDVVVNEYNEIVLENNTMCSTEDYVPVEYGYFINNESLLLFDHGEDNTFNSTIHENPAIYRRIFYRERLRTPKEVFKVYNQVRSKSHKIDRTHLSYKRYKRFNMFVDFYFYNQIFFKNNMWKLDRGLNLYFEILTKFLKDPRLETNGYTQQTVIIPVNDWKRFAGDSKMHMFRESINPISIIYRYLKTDIEKLQRNWGGIDFIFLGQNGYFKVDFNDLTKARTAKFLTFIRRIQDDTYVVSDIEDFTNDLEDEDVDLEPDTKESSLTISDNIVSKIEYKTKIKINNLTGTGDTSLDKLVDKINKASASSKDTDEAMDKIEDDEEVKRLLVDISKQEDKNTTMNPVREKRMKGLRDSFSEIKLRDKRVDDILNDMSDNIDIPSTELDIDSVNSEWKDIKFINFEDIYDVEEDVLKVIKSFNDERKTTPVGVRKIDVEDSSTSEDYKSTYTFHLEDFNGKRYQLKLDIPELVDNRFLMINGNKKSLSRQLMVLPVIKTGRDTVQVATDYNKIFLTKLGTRKYVVSDRLSKTIAKLDVQYNSFDVKYGDNTRTNSEFVLPMDYVEMFQQYNSITTKDYVFLFNQKEIREKYKDIFKENKKGFPMAYDRSKNELVYCNYDEIYSIKFRDMLLSQSENYVKVYNSTNVAKRYAYTRARILKNNVPLIVMLGYNEGLGSVLTKANIKFEIHDTRPRYDKDTHDIIRFNDGYILYKLTYDSSLLLNGLKACATENYNLAEINNRSMYLDFLDNFGGRILADGLDNFYELMLDHISLEVLEKYDLPTDYVSLLVYASSLLADDDYSKHTDMTKVRYRSNEMISACVYKVLSKAYGRYKNEIKAGRKDPKMSVKQTAVLDELMALNNLEDVSILSHVLEAETLHSVSSKGPSGLNSERAYGLDKRAFDESMLNIIAMSTPQGPGVGVNRQTTIDPNIKDKRGYLEIVKDPEKEISVTKTFGISEAMTPFSSRRDDPSRTSMNLSQTKHTMRVAHGDPLLVTNGTDEALPYMLTNTFSYKTKDSGEVIDKTDDIMIIKYKNGDTEYVDLRTNTEKNSSSGFYINLKLDTELNIGDKFKKNEIIAYDKQSYSKAPGVKGKISAIMGPLVKLAILNTDDGFEDSGIISERLSDRMASDIVMKKAVQLDKGTNIYNMVKKGDAIREGDPLVTIQESSDEDDINVLLRNLSGSEEEVTNLGRISIKSKYTGVIQDIKVFRTVNKSDLSPSLKKEVEKIENRTKGIKRTMNKYGVKNANRFSDPDYKLEPKGKLKNLDEGVMIEFYIKYADKMSKGDKFTDFVALKQIVSEIFPEGDEPYTDFRPEEKLDSLMSLSGCNARMITSVKINMVLNKMLIELNRSVKDILNIDHDTNNEW